MAVQPQRRHGQGTQPLRQPVRRAGLHLFLPMPGDGPGTADRRGDGDVCGQAQLREGPAHVGGAPQGRHEQAQGVLRLYLVAQLVDNRLFHFWRRLTRGKALWFRNNMSTGLSQLVDTIIVNGIFLRVVMGVAAPNGSSTVVRDLNPHLDYTTSTLPQSERDKSVGDPRLA